MTSINNSIRTNESIFITDCDVITVIACGCCEKKQKGDTVQVNVVNSREDKKKISCPIIRWITWQFRRLTGSRVSERRDIIACECGKLLKSTSRFEKWTTTKSTARLLGSFTTSIMPPMSHSKKQLDSLIKANNFDWLFIENEIYWKLHMWHKNECKCCDHDSTQRCKPIRCTIATIQKA